MISWADSNPTCSTPEIIGFAGAAARVKNRFCASAMRRLSSAAPQSALRFAAEAGYAVGTLYDYFPDKRALFSEYVRYTLDDMLSRIDREVIARRRRRFASPGGDHVRRRRRGAEDKHHKRVFEELTAKWREAVGAWQDMPGRASPETIGALALALWASRRYVLLVGPAAEKTDWVAQARTDLPTRVGAGLA